MENVKVLLSEIKEGLNGKCSSSQKDEIRVMKAMLNDKEYQVGIYGNDGLEGTMSPYQEARDMITSVIADTTKITTAEARQLADEYEFKKAEAVNMINLSKEFTNTYLDSGRKLPLGGRETSNVALAKKDVAEGTRNYPKQVGVDEAGNAIYKTVPTDTIPAHNTIKVFGSCPSWMKK